jgi:hypothetical protein
MNTCDLRLHPLLAYLHICKAIQRAWTV